VFGRGRTWKWFSNSYFFIAKAPGENRHIVTFGHYNQNHQAYWSERQRKREIKIVGVWARERNKEIDRKQIEGI
jgi:hypothetical protein